MTDTEKLLESAHAHMTQNYAPPPFVVAGGKGTTLFDTDGKEYLDFAGGIGVIALGHGHARIAAAIAEQAKQVCHTSNLFHHDGYIRVCERLSELSFGDRVYLANSGTEAIEAALKLARRYFWARGDKQRTDFVATEKSFHGRTYGSVSVTGQPKLQEGFGPLLPGVSHVPYGDTDALEKAVGPTTAAVIIEPVQGNGGIVVAPPGYLAAVRSICDTAGCLFILDEVQTGIGRTGKWFAYEHDGVTPDIMALAKMLGGGLPLAAMVTRTDISAALTPGSHASTYGGNPVACAACLATLDVIAEENLLANANAMGEKLRALLAPLVDKHDIALEVRGRGLMNGLRVRDSARPLKDACLERRLLTTLAGPEVLRLMPPLNVSTEEIERAASIIAEALASL
jgi:acetylornithine/N-succinyldiaminopimelate aminotransferase